MKGTVDGRAVALGNAAMLADLELQRAASAATEARRDRGETVMFAVVDGAVAGLVSVADPVKETTPTALKALHDLGFRIVMATGDNERTARAVAGKLGIDEIRAVVLPEDKARIIRELQAAGAKVAMAGDGVNDAPASSPSRRCATSARICSSRWSTTPPACRSPRASSTRFSNC